jgi:Uma2 family endonuclease
MLGAMADATEASWLDFDAYLALERTEGRRLEWFAGRVYAMAGGTLAHAELAAALIAELRTLVHGRGCRVYTSDAKVRVVATGLATYPDVAVVCGAVVRDRDDPNAMTNPIVLVEVLSEGTEAYDRGDKFAHYQELPSLQHYVLASQHEARIEVYTRAESAWVLRAARSGGQAALSALGGALSVDRVYEGIALEPPPRPGALSRA